MPQADITKTGIPVVARHHLIGDGQDVLPGGIFYASDERAARRLYRLDAARPVDEPEPRTTEVDTGAGESF